eukprot:14107523-Alexandrium_andersonii.AAC.1
MLVTTHPVHTSVVERLLPYSLQGRIGSTNTGASQRGGGKLLSAGGASSGVRANSPASFAYLALFAAARHAHRQQLNESHM